MAQEIKLFISFIGVLLIIISTNQAAGSADNTSINNLINELSSNSNISIRAIIALDSSTSINSEDATSAAHQIIKAVAKLNNSENEIGYVSWNHGCENYNAPGNDFNKTLENISKTGFGGNTCLEKGLNKSISLLGEPVINKKSMIIIISDGNENCNLSDISNLTCSRAKQIIPDNVDVRIIPIGKSKNKNNIISCFNVPSDPDPINITDGIVKEIQTNERFQNTFSISARGSSTKYQEQRTKVNITKIVEQGSSGGPKIRIRIETPDGPNVPNSIVLALDSSGSLGIGGNPSYGENLRTAINPVMKEIKEKLPKSNISVLSWDGDIDFAFWPIGNNDPKIADFKMIDNAIDEIRKNRVFEDYPIDIAGFEFQNPLSHDLYPSGYYNCSEEDPTDFTVGLQGAIDVLNKSHSRPPINENDTDLCSIIFVTARSEFIPFSKNPKLIEEANNSEYHIYTLGIGVMNKSHMEKDLIYAAKQTGGKYHYSSGSYKWSKNAIIDEVTNIVNEIRDMTLVNNIVLVDTVYPYFDIITPTIKATMTRGNNVTKLAIHPIIVHNRDDTTTIELNLKENLSRNTILEISMDTKLNLSLPVDVTKEKRNIYRNWEIDHVTKPSTITYGWHTGRSYRMYLPENSITFV
jgi:hypothetical protein